MNFTNCPKCNFDIDTNQIKCSRCKTNINMFKKCIVTSYKLYNKGLLLANNGEFTNAIECLKKSLLCNKHNTNARNLLGLLYYQIGHFSDAMKQWILSTNFDGSSENIATSYINKIRKNMRKFEKANDAVRLYNQSIKYLNKKNDDLAIIRLKNALKISPNFIDAMNLLTFCYIIQSKNKKALAIVQNTLKIDINNKQALLYLSKINISEESTLLDEKYISNGKVDILSDLEEDENYKPKSNFNLTSNFAMFIFGIVASFLFMYFLYIPDFKENYAQNYEASKSQYDESKASYELLKEELSIENEQLKAEIEELQNQLQISNAAISLTLNKEKLTQVSSLLSENKKDEARVIFETIDISGFSEEEINLYNEIKSNF